MPYLVLAYYYFTQVQYNWHSLSALEYVFYAFLGLLFFSFIEYSLHRFIFHSEKKLYNNRFLRYMHFMTHGIHHMFPFDPYRLVLPPAFILIVIGISYKTVYPFIHFDDYVKDLVFYTAFMTGYCIYDCTHYFLHHLELKANSEKDFYLVSQAKRMFNSVKKHHNQHHYSGEDAGYGVSTPLWDWIFRSDFKGKRQ